MKTLIELFDDSPILNVLACVAFKPEKIIFFGANENEIKESRKDYPRFFKRRNEDVKIEFVCADMSNIEEVDKSLENIIKENPDCVVDVSGGRDVALLAAGMSAARLGVPLTIYNRNTRQYLNISNFEQAGRVNVSGMLDCEDFFTASGGNVTEYEDFSGLERDLTQFWQTVLLVWNIYLENRRVWATHVQYLQKVSSAAKSDGSFALNARCPATVRVNGRELRRNDAILTKLFDCGAIVNLKTNASGDWQFEYSDAEFRRYLTDVGAFLELYVHVCALRTGKFSSVLSRVKYNWEYDGRLQQKKVVISRPASNEIDVIAINGIEPLFISCKTSSPDMRYIDEIYPQVMRMSGGEGHAVFVCTHTVDSDMPLYNKSKALGVFIIDGDDIDNNLVEERLAQIADGQYVWRDEPEYMDFLKKKRSRP